MTDEKTLAFIKEHEKDDVRLLALQAARFPEINMPFVIRQIKGRQIAREKIPSWYAVDSIIFPPSVSLEQSSSEKTATYKAGLCSGDSFVDLTGGLGVDFSFMSRNFKSAVYVEKQNELTETAKHNFRELGLENINIVNTDAESYLNEMPVCDILFLDPSRRNNQGKKTVKIEDCSPNLIGIDSLLSEKSKKAIIKLSPMLDISQAVRSLQNISEVHIISHNNECKELLFVKDNIVKGTSLSFFCVNIIEQKTDIEIFGKEEEEHAEIQYTKEVSNYLYEPNASILKAGFYKSIALRYNVKKLHPNSHLYTSENEVADFPGRTFTVKEVIPFNKKNSKELSKKIQQANVTTRNFPMTVDELRKRTGLKDGGDLYIFATTTADNQKIMIVCEKI